MPERKPVSNLPRVRRELRRLRMPAASEGLRWGGICGLEIAERELAADRKPAPKMQLVKGGARG